MPKRSLTLLVLALALPLTIFGFVVNAAASTVQLDNEYIRIVVNTREHNMGRFAVGTTGGDPNRETDQNKHLIYGGDDPWTSYTTIRIDNQNYIFGSPTDRRAGQGQTYGEMVQAPTLVDDAIETIWQLGPIRVWQILSITRSSTTGLLDTAQIEYLVENTDSVPHMVGARLMLDTMLGSNDGAPFRVDDEALTNDTVRYSHNMPQFWQAFDSLVNPQVMSQGTLSGAGVTTPDRVYFTNWGSLADQPWNFDFRPGRDFLRTGEFELDSAIALFWDPQELKPGESRRYLSQYGLGGVTIAPGDLVLGVTSPASVTADTEGIQTFSIIAYIQNAGQGDALDVVAEINLPPGLELVGGQRQVKLADLEVNETKQTGWTVRTLPNSEGMFTYEVKVSALNSEPNLVKRSVEVLTPARLNVLLTGEPAALSIKAEKYDPPTLSATARIKNEGGAPAHNVFLEFLSPLGLSLVGDQNSKRFLGNVEPNEEIIVNWILEPTGNHTVPVVRYHVSVRTDRAGDSDVKTNSVIIPDLQEKIWIEYPERVVVGDYFPVHIWATNFRNFSGAELDLSFDPALLTVVGRTLDLSRGTLFISEEGASDRSIAWQMPAISNQEGTVVGLKAWRAEPVELSYGTLLTLYFTAVKQGEAVIALEQILVDTGQAGLEEVSLPEQARIIIEPKL